MGQLLCEIDSRELAEWMAYDRLEPFGEQRGDVRTAIVAQTVANTHRGPKQKPYKLDAFLPKYGDRATPDKTPDQLLAIAEMLNAAFGGVDLREIGSPLTTRNGTER